MSNENSLSDDEIDRLTQGTLVNGDIPQKYDDPKESFSNSVTIYDNVITLTDPESKETKFSIHPEGVPERGALMIDFFHGQPYLYLYDPLREETQYTFKLPTKDDPSLTLKEGPRR